MRKAWEQGHFTFCEVARAYRRIRAVSLRVYGILTKNFVIYHPQNDIFQGWAVIVTKISEAMNHLTGHDDSEEGAVAHAIEQWIEGCDR